MAFLNNVITAAQVVAYMVALVAQDVGALSVVTLPNIGVQIAIPNPLLLVLLKLTSELLVNAVVSAA